MKNKDNKLDFTGQTIYIGLDVHKKNWSVTTYFQGIKLKTMSMIPKPEQLVRYLHKNYPNATYMSVYEAGFCGYWIDRKLRQLGVNNIIVNPADIPTKQKERRHKTDKVDSKKLARELGSNNLEGIYIPSEENESIRALSRLRRQTVKDQTRIKCRIKSLLQFVGIEMPENRELKYWSGRFIKYLSELDFKHKPMKLTLDGLLESLIKQRQILVRVVKDLREIVEENQRVKKIVKLLQTVPGVGFITAITLYAEIMDISRFRKFDSLSCLIGFSPATDSSGERDKVVGISNQQNKYLRSMLIESAWTAIRKDPALTQAYGKLVMRMGKQKAIVRIAKKLLNRIMYVWRNEKEYVCAVVS
jgi:transposase